MRTISAKFKFSWFKSKKDNENVFPPALAHSTGCAQQQNGYRPFPYSPSVYVQETNHVLPSARPSPSGPEAVHMHTGPATTGYAYPSHMHPGHTHHGNVAVQQQNGYAQTAYQPNGYAHDYVAVQQQNGYAQTAYQPNGYGYTQPPPESTHGFHEVTLTHAKICQEAKNLNIQGSQMNLPPTDTIEAFDKADGVTIANTVMNFGFTMQEIAMNPVQPVMTRSPPPQQYHQTQYNPQAQYWPNPSPPPVPTPPHSSPVPQMWHDDHGDLK